MVPYNSRAIVFPQQMGEQPLMVPKLDGVGVRNPSERGRGRRSPVCRQYGFPHHQHTNRLCSKLAQSTPYCGGPPQTPRSSRGYQHQHPYCVWRRVESTLERAEILWRQAEERRLPWRSLAATVIVDSTRSNHCHHQNQDCKMFSVHGSPCDHSGHCVRQHLGKKDGHNYKGR